MGTDIHMQVERRNERGEWEWVRELPPRICHYCESHPGHENCGKPVVAGERTSWGAPIVEGATCYIWKGHDEKDPEHKCAACYHCGGTKLNREPYHARNYDVFAILADVRNGYGFAGVDTGDGFRPMLAAGWNKVAKEWEGARRGLPSDLSPELRYAARHELRAMGGRFANLDIGELPRPAAFGPPLTEEQEDEDGGDYDYKMNVPNFGDHSFNWVTLAEVLAYNWERTSQHRGAVSAKEYIDWRESGGKGSPASYSGGVSGQGVRNVSNAEMDRLIARGEIAQGEVWPEAKVYTQVEWGETYRESAGTEWFRFLDSLTPLGKSEDIRLVFGFDS